MSQRSTRRVDALTGGRGRNVSLDIPFQFAKLQLSLEGVWVALCLIALTLLFSNLAHLALFAFLLGVVCNASANLLGILSVSMIFRTSHSHESDLGFTEKMVGAASITVGTIAAFLLYDRWTVLLATGDDATALDARLISGSWYIASFVCVGYVLAATAFRKRR
jgi:hypothetical protein